MLVGHYSAAFLAKTVDPRVPLWGLAVAVQLVDVLWALFVLGGIEHLRLDPGLPSNPLDLYHMPYTHSLVGSFVWAALAFVVARQWLESRRAAWVTAAAVLSHWLLDLLVHRADLTLWGAPPKFGFALWNLPAIALALELGLLAGSAWLYLRSHPLSPNARRAVVAFVSALLVVQVVTTLAPPALGPEGVAVTALVLFAAVALAARSVDRAAAAVTV